MNRAILMGRLTRDPDVRYSGQGESGVSVARFTLAVDRRGRRQEGEQNADFIPCVVFGRLAEFAEQYLHQGIKVILEGRIQTGSYTNNEGRRVYTTDVIGQNIEFAERKAPDYERVDGVQMDPAKASEGFMEIPEGIENEGLPFA